MPTHDWNIFKDACLMHQSIERIGDNDTQLAKESNNYEVSMMSLRKLMNVNEWCTW